MGASHSIAEIFPHPGAESAVLGWQEAVLNQNGVCDECNAILPKGARAAIGLPARPRPVFLCLECLATLSSAGRDVDEEAGQPHVEESRSTKKSRSQE